MTNSKPQDVPRTLKFTIENTIVYVDKPSIGGGGRWGGWRGWEQTNSSCFFFLVSLESNNLNGWALQAGNENWKHEKKFHVKKFEERDISGLFTNEIHTTVMLRNEMLISS